MWTRDWPTIPGRYWFLEDVNPDYPDRKLDNRYRLASVKELRDGQHMYATEGRFLYKEDCKGMWWSIPVEVPAPPEE